MGTIQMPQPEILAPAQQAAPAPVPSPPPPTLDASTLDPPPPTTYPVQCSVGVIDDQSKVQMLLNDGKNINYPVTFTPVDARSLGLALLYKATESEILTQLKNTPAEQTT